MIALPIGRVAAGAMSSGRDPAEALIARMVVPPSPERANLIKALVKSLVDSGIWYKLDVLYLTAAHDEQAARLNWVSSSFTLSPVNNPVFTVDRGYVSDGASSYLDSGFTISTPGAATQMNSSHMGVSVTTNPNGSNALYEIGNLRLRMNVRTSASLFSAWTFSGTQISATVATALGHSMWSRRGAADASIYKDGVNIGDSTVASSAANTDTFNLCALSSNGVPTNFSTRRVSAAHWGGGLTNTQASALYAALNTYLTGVGA